MVKELIKSFCFPNIPSLVNLTERWLRKKALDGWRLEHAYRWKFTFRKCHPYETIYFMYSSLDKSNGISNSYYRAKSKYSRKNSILNKTNFRIFEVDTNKIDSDFLYYIMIRNQYYLKHYFTLFVISLLSTTVMFGIVKYGLIVKLMVMIGTFFVSYSLISVLMLVIEIKNTKNQRLE